MALVFRSEKFLSIPEAAERLGVARLTVYRWLRGTRRAPKGIGLHRVIHDTRTKQVYIPKVVVVRLRQALRGTQSHAPQRRRRRPRRS